MRYPVICAAMAALALSACGGSKESLREDVVSCSAYLNALNMQIMNGNRAFSDRIMERLVKSDASDAEQQREALGRKLSDIGEGAERYQSDLDPARLSVIAEEERKAAEEHVSKGQDAKAAARIKACAATWDQLGRG